MKKVIFSLILLMIGLTMWSQPRPVKLSSTVIIDTDCGFDDLRAISLLLSRPEIIVKAFLTTDGSLSPEEGAEKVLTLLHEFNKSSIPVACGDVAKTINPGWRPFCSSINWGSRNDSKVAGISAADYILKALTGENEKITFVCLGSLTNVWSAIKKDATILNRIDRIVWYNESVKPMKGFNYDCDMESANALFRSNVRIDVISNLNVEEALFDGSLVSVCADSKTLLADVLNNVFMQKPVIDNLKKNHFKLSDDLVSLYITNPELFGINTDLDKLNVRYNRSYDIAGAKEAISDMIKGTYVAERSVVFNSFPVNR
ncbi:MAG TPA: hypothetical protein DCZ51_00205, partial [Bacteroidales bacterium]|nr:hypothetical protein [Bacteroidales bacterium]